MTPTAMGTKSIGKEEEKANPSTRRILYKINKKKKQQQQHNSNGKKYSLQDEKRNIRGRRRRRKRRKVANAQRADKSSCIPG